MDNIKSLNSVLVGIGCFTSISIGKSLESTRFNLSIRDLFIHSTFFKTNSKKLLDLLSSLLRTYSKEGSLYDKIHSIFNKKKLLLVVDEVPGLKSKIKAQNFDFNLYQDDNPGNRKEPSSGDSDLGNGRRKTIRRSEKDFLKSVANAKKVYPPKPWETPEQYDRRIRHKDSKRWTKSDKTEPIFNYSEDQKKRDPWVVRQNVEDLKKEMPIVPGETTDHWLRRLGDEERYRAKELSINPNRIFESRSRAYTEPAVPRIIVDNFRRNNPWDPNVETRNRYMNRTYLKAKRIYDSGDTNYENNLPSSPRSDKRKRS